MRLKLLLALLFLTQIFSALSQRIRYEDRSPVYFGLNTGVTWHTADVQNEDYRVRAGGFILGVALNEDYGNAVSFDLRFRGLLGSWRGLDSDTLGFLSSNNVLNDTYGQTNGPGFSVQNFRALQAHWGLELAIHANRFRERTGVDPYIFGGVSFVSTLTEGDLFNSGGGLYDYASNPSGSLIENTYNTALDAGANGEVYTDAIANIMPSLGVGIGYYVTSRFSIGIEHKSTFFSNDYFDGSTVDQAGVIDGLNDIYHYTGGYLRWYLKSKERTEVVEETAPRPSPVVGAYSRGPEESRTPPAVNFTTPNVSPFETNVQTITLRADIQEVQKAQFVSFTQDGIVNHNFTYNALSNVFQSTVQLKPGQNVFNLRGTNDFGVDTDQITIVYNPRESLREPPVVNITDPSTDPHLTNTNQYLVKAKIEYVDSKSDVSLFVNGQNAGSNFDFTPLGSNNFSAIVNLNAGPNLIEVKGVNQQGNASDNITIIYERKPDEPSIDPPVVDFVSPFESPYNVQSNQFNLIATVLNVADRNQITFVQNGQSNSNFSFNASTETFNANVVLSPGANIFQITGTNQAGVDQATVIINYDVPSPKPPIVSINTPSVNPYSTTSSNQSLIATVLNVDTKSQIQVTLNGSNFSQFSFNPASSVLTTVLPLQVGQNKVTVRGTNSDGVDMASTTILYRKPLQDPPPVVNIIEPNTSPFTTENETETITATVDNVTVKNQVNVNVNGVNTSNFTFDSNNGVVQLNSTLILGANTITITGTNAVGSDSESTTILYRKAEERHPPVVSFLIPAMNPATTFNSSFNVQAKVQHVSGSQDIQLKINGVNSSLFSFNSASQIMDFTTSLVNGANLIQVIATNAHGQDSKTTTIIYKKINPILPPVVTITTPAQSTYTVNSSSTPVVATVLNVATKNDIDVIVNGNSINNFTYNTSSKVLNFNMALNAGANDVVIVGTNNAGTAQDNRTIIYRRGEPVSPPLVSYINPPNAGLEVTNATFNLTATVENVDSKNDIQLRFDGQLISHSNFSFNTVNKQLSYSANLSFGNNTFEIKGTNAAGSHQASTNIIYVEPEPDCDEPTVAFILPSQNNTTVSEDEYTIKAMVHNVDNINQIQLLLNGNGVGNFSYDGQTHELSRKLNLDEGNNIIEIRIVTDCGVATSSKIIKYSPPTEICDDPVIALIEPHVTPFTTQLEEITVFASVSNVDNIQQLQLTVNGAGQNFNYDVGTHTISATVPLAIGNNTVKIIATNNCGSVYDQWTIKREACQDPMANLSVSPSGSVVNVDQVTLTGTITEVTEQQISLTVNGQVSSFVFDSNTQSFNASVNLNEGMNQIIVTGTNNCGLSRTSFNITYEPLVVVDPPSVNISNPSSSPFATENATYNVVANVTNISSSNQISVTVNNIQHSFNFDVATQEVTFNLNLQEGSNVIDISVVNDGGIDNDTKTIVYSIPEVIEPPLVAFTNPSTLTSDKEDGAYSITGNVTNLSSTNQLNLFVNNVPVNNAVTNVTSSGIDFSFMLSVSASHDVYEITAEGANSAGSDSKTIFINRLVEEEEEEVNCMSIVSATFSSDATSTTVTSDKDLSNVVLKFSDETTQKFDNLSGMSQTFSGTGQNQQKCIVGVWIKSGCNQSGDGPGFGEFVLNSNYDGRCENVPCEAPVVTVTSPTSVQDGNYTLSFEITDVQANHVGVTLNNAPINCSFDALQNSFSCDVQLAEGNNTFIITADGCETTTEIHDVLFTVPCSPISYNRIFPSGANHLTNDEHMSVNLTVQEVTFNNISVTLNGLSVTPVLSGNSLLIEHLNLNEGSNRLTVNLTNDCSSETVNYTLTYEVPSPCGPRINPGNSDWQFCLVTPSGTYNRSDLQNSNFTYNGPASNVYFLPIAGGGDVTVNGSPYSVQPGMYYFFEGNLTVEVSSQKPGAMGHWTVCVTSDSAPMFGNGSRRPASPCESKNIEIQKPKPSGTQTKPTRQPRTIQTKPNGAETIRTRPESSGNTKPIKVTKPSGASSTRTTRTTKETKPTTRTTRTTRERGD
jgi:hypothetical protein